jgi:predicted kinase
MNKSATATETGTTKHMVFTMGLPGSGKTTVATILHPLYGILDPDIYKLDHPDYDPNDPSAVHEWSQVVMEKEFSLALSTSGSYIVDGTGVNSEKMVRRILQAQAAGFTTTLLYVKVSLNTAIARNANRDRTVDERLIRSKANDIATSFDIVSGYADDNQVVVNE